MNKSHKSSFHGTGDYRRSDPCFERRTGDSQYWYALISISSSVATANFPVNIAHIQRKQLTGIKRNYGPTTDENGMSSWRKAIFITSTSVAWTSVPLWSQKLNRTKLGIHTPRTSSDRNIVILRVLPQTAHVRSVKITTRKEFVRKNIVWRLRIRRDFQQGIWRGSTCLESAIAL